MNGNLKVVSELALNLSKNTSVNVPCTLSTKGRTNVLDIVHLTATKVVRIGSRIPSHRLDFLEAGTEPVWIRYRDLKVHVDR